MNNVGDRIIYNEKLYKIEKDYGNGIYFIGNENEFIDLVKNGDFLNIDLLLKSREWDREDRIRITTERDRARIDLLHIKEAVFKTDYQDRTWQETVEKIKKYKKI